MFYFKDIVLLIKCNYPIKITFNNNILVFIDVKFLSRKKKENTFKNLITNESKYKNSNCNHTFSIQMITILVKSDFSLPSYCRSSSSYKSSKSTKKNCNYGCYKY